MNVYNNWKKCYTNILVLFEKKKKEYKKQSQRCKQNPVKVKDILSLVKGNISLKGKRSKIKKKNEWKHYKFLNILLKKKLANYIFEVISKT